MQDLGSVSLFFTQYWQLVVSLVIGSSGLAGWFLTYLDLRQQRQLEARKLFRELVLTPDILQLYGMDFDLLDLYGALIELRQGKQPIVKLPETRGRLMTITSEKQLLGLTLRAFARIGDLTDKVSRAGLTLLLPWRLRKKAGDVARTLRSSKSLDDIEKARKQLFEFGDELKKVLGLHVLEEKSLTASRHSEAYSNASLIAFGIAIGYASGLLPEQNLWALTIGLSACAVAYFVIAHRQKLGTSWNYGLQTLALALAALAPLTSKPLSWIWVVVFLMLGCLGAILTLHPRTHASNERDSLAGVAPEPQLPSSLGVNYP